MTKSPDFLVFSIILNVVKITRPLRSYRTPNSIFFVWRMCCVHEIFSEHNFYFVHQYYTECVFISLSFCARGIIDHFGVIFISDRHVFAQSEAW